MGGNENPRSQLGMEPTARECGLNCDGTQVQQRSAIALAVCLKTRLEPALPDETRAGLCCLADWRLNNSRLSQAHCLVARGGNPPRSESAPHRSPGDATTIGCPLRPTAEYPRARTNGAGWGR